MHHYTSSQKNKSYGKKSLTNSTNGSQKQQPCHEELQQQFELSSHIHHDTIFQHQQNNNQHSNLSSHMNTQYLPFSTISSFPSQATQTQTQTTLNKIILIESFEGQQSYMKFSQQYSVLIPYDSQMRQLDVGYVLHKIFFQVLDCQYEYQIFYYREVTNGDEEVESCYGNSSVGDRKRGYFQFVGMYPFKQKFMLGEEFIPKNEIFITFRKVRYIGNTFKKQFGATFANHHNKNHYQICNSMAMPIQSPLQSVQSFESSTIGSGFQSNDISFSSSAQEIKMKKRRINDRTIQEILQKVSLWRSISQEKKITLQEASKFEILNKIPKKTLDDYFSLIKQGEKWGFEFEKKLTEKIGVLRQYVKDCSSCCLKQRKQKEETSKVKRELKGLTKSKKQVIKSDNEGKIEIQEANHGLQSLSIVDKMVYGNDQMSEEREKGEWKQDGFEREVQISMLELDFNNFSEMEDNSDQIYSSEEEQEEEEE